MEGKGYKRGYGIRVVLCLNYTSRKEIVQQWKRKTAENFLNVDENRAEPTLMSLGSAQLQLKQIEIQPIRERVEEESAGLLQERYARGKSREALPKNW